MKRLTLILCAALAVCACTQKEPDPVAEAIAAELTKDIDQPFDISVHNLQLLDSTTFATEFQRRISIYDIRLQQNTERLEKYIRQGMKKNATLMYDELKKDTKIYNELIGLKEMMGEDTLKIAYYDYSFTYGGKVGSSKLSDKQAWATVTPECKVLTCVSDQRDLHKATGLVIPGYKELLDSFKEETKE